MNVMSNHRWLLPTLVIGLVLVGVFCFNLFCPDDHDTFSYAFAGQNSTFDTTRRVASLGDVVQQQIRDYLYPPGNGRVIVHGITALFSGFRLWTLFDVLNTVMWGLFTWLVLRAGGLQWGKTSPWGWAVGSVGVWWFLWRGECTLNIAFALNYLWPATATVVVLVIWPRLRWWMVPLAFIYGWSQECFVVPMVAALAVETGLRSWRERRVVCSLQQAIAWVLMACGCALLCLGPASRHRAGDILDTTLVTFLMELCKAQVKFFLSLAPMGLLGGVIVIAWRTRKQLVDTFWTSSRWWLYLGASYGSLLMMAHKGLSGRVALPTLMAAMILVLRHRQCIRIPRWAIATSVVLALLWMGGALWTQRNLGREFHAMVQRYCDNLQGITYWQPVFTGCFYTDVWNPGYNRFHTTVLTLETGRKTPVTILSPTLYKQLYCQMEPFFREATLIPGTRCYIHPAAPRLAVACGDITLTKAESNLILLQLLRPKKNARAFRYLPGRFRLMLTCDDDGKLLLPQDKWVIQAVDGMRYTLFSLGKKKPTWPIVD